MNSTYYSKYNWKGKKVLVTGGAGFIGSCLTEALVNIGADVTVIDNLSTGKLDNLLDIFKHVKFIRGDIKDFELVKSMVKDKDYVFHLAAVANLDWATKDPDKATKINVQGTYNVVEACRSLHVPMDFASTACVYPCSIQDTEVDILLKAAARGTSHSKQNTTES